MFCSFDRQAVPAVVEEHLRDGSEGFAKLPENVSLAGAFLNLHVHKATSGLDWQWIVIGGGFWIPHQKTAFLVKSERILCLMTSYRPMVPFLPVEWEIEVDRQLIVYAMIRDHVFNHSFMCMIFGVIDVYKSLIAGECPSCSCWNRCKLLILRLFHGQPHIGLVLTGLRGWWPHGRPL